jgi:iron complex transport system substrate-binding protein
VRSGVVGLLLAACVTAVAAQRSPDPSRIVSTSPSITETLFALGLGPRVVGVSSYCRYPAGVEKLPHVGSFLKPDAEAIARLRPDLVLVHVGPHTVPQQLATLGISVATVDRGTLAGIYSSIRSVAVAVGVRGRGEALVTAIQHRLDAARTAARLHPPRRVLLVVGRQPGTLTDLIAVGPGSFLHDLIEAAGGVNVLGDAKLPEYPHVSMETVIRLAPDVIVDAGDMGDTVEEHRRRQAATERLWRQQVNVKAARNGDVHAVTSDAFVVPGPRVVEAVETMAQWLDAVGRRKP